MNWGKLPSDLLHYFIAKQKLNNQQISPLEEHADKMHPPDQQNGNGKGDVLSTVFFGGGVIMERELSLWAKLAASESSTMNEAELKYGG